VISLAADEFEGELDRLTDRGYLEDDGGTLKGRTRRRLDRAPHASDDGEEFVVRPARRDDVVGLIDAIRDVASEDTDIVVDQLLYEDTVQRHVAVESGVFVVGTVDGDVVGWVH
jgi:hypothetical protein